jgi:hypothetical protein
LKLSHKLNGILPVTLVHIVLKLHSTHSISMHACAGPIYTDILHPSMKSGLVPATAPP